MKKLLFVILMVLNAASTKAAIFFNNLTGCDMWVSLEAHDANGTGLCSYFSGRFLVPAGSTSISFANVTNLNTTPGWVKYSNPLVPATMISMGSGWDAATVDWDGTVQKVGNVLGCATTTTQGYSTSCGTATLTWTVFGPGNIMVKLQ